MKLDANMLIEVNVFVQQVPGGGVPEPPPRLITLTPPAACSQHPNTQKLFCRALWRDRSTSTEHGPSKWAAQLGFYAHRGTLSWLVAVLRFLVCIIDEFYTLVKRLFSFTGNPVEARVTKTADGWEGRQKGTTPTVSLLFSPKLFPGIRSPLPQSVAESVLVGHFSRRWCKDRWEGYRGTRGQTL